MRIAITHKTIDLDAASSLWFLERKKKIDDIIFCGKEFFGIEDFEKIKREKEVNEIVFADFRPSEELRNILREKKIKVKVYDHHQLQTREQKSSFELLIEDQDTEGLNQNKLYEWQKVVHHSDFKTENDDMDIQRTLKIRMPLIFDNNDYQVYKQWFVPLIESFFRNKKNIQRGQKILQETILQFTLSNPTSPAKSNLQRWSERLKDLKIILESSLRNMFHYVSHMDKETGERWMRLTLRALDVEQNQFQKGKKAFKDADIDLFGKTLVASQITSSSTFTKAARNIVKSHIDYIEKKEKPTEVEEEKEIPTKIRETITSRADPWVIIQVDPEKKHFQISAGGGGKNTQQAIFRELIKAVRVEILKKRRQPIPRWEELSKGETIEGTDPLYFNDKSFPQILWGSLTRPEIDPATPFGKTSREIKQNLVNITKQVIDKNYFPRECNPKSCQYCMMSSWQLQKCWLKRKSTNRFDKI